MRVTIEAEGFDAVSRHLRAIQKTPQSRRTWGTIAQVLRRESMMCFKNQRGPDGKAWAPLAPSTIEGRAYRATKGYRSRLKKKRRGRHSKVFKRHLVGAKALEDSGTLRGSVVTEYDDRSAAVGTTLSYARVHQFGSSRKKIPSRPFIGMSATGLLLVRKILERALVKVGGHFVSRG